jgi:hypothetical protein
MGAEGEKKVREEKGEGERKGKVREGEFNRTNG